MLFGEKLKNIRIANGWTQEDLAKKLGTSKQVISRYENNQRTPIITIAAEYARILNVSVDFLINNEVEHIENHKTTTASLTPKNERDIQKRLSDILSDLESDAALSFYNGDEPLDEETKELLKASLENSITVAKLKAKKKFTTKKNQRQD